MSEPQELIERCREIRRKYDSCKDKTDDLLHNIPRIILHPDWNRPNGYTIVPWEGMDYSKLNGEVIVRRDSDGAIIHNCGDQVFPGETLIGHTTNCRVVEGVLVCDFKPLDNAFSPIEEDTVNVVLSSKSPSSKTEMKVVEYRLPICRLLGARGRVLGYMYDAKEENGVATVAVRSSLEHVTAKSPSSGPPYGIPDCTNATLPNPNGPIVNFDRNAGKYDPTIVTLPNPLNIRESLEFLKGMWDNILVSEMRGVCGLPHPLPTNTEEPGKPLTITYPNDDTAYIPSLPESSNVSVKVENIEDMNVTKWADGALQEPHVQTVPHNIGRTIKAEDVPIGRKFRDVHGNLFRYTNEATLEVIRGDRRYVSIAEQVTLVEECPLCSDKGGHFDPRSLDWVPCSCGGGSAG